MKSITLRYLSPKKIRTKDPVERKTREKIINLQKKCDASNNTMEKIYEYKSQIIMINKLYLGEEFIERKFVLSELNTKINSYKHQDIKKDFHEIENLITLDNAIEKLVNCKLKCYYCNNNLKIIFEKVRDCKQ